MTKADQKHRDMIADYQQRIRAVRDLYGDVFAKKDEIRAEREKDQKRRKREKYNRWYEKKKAALQEQQKGQG